MDGRKTGAATQEFCEKPPAVEYIRVIIPPQGVIAKLKSLLVL